MGNKVNKNVSEEGYKVSSPDSLRNSFPYVQSTDSAAPPSATKGDVKVIQDDDLPVVHDGTECVIEEDPDSCGDIFYDAEEADEARLAYMDLKVEEEEDDPDEEEDDGDDEEETSSSSHELLVETLRTIREKKLLKTKQIEIRNLDLLNRSWADAATQTEAAQENGQQSSDCVQAEVLGNLIVQVEELLSHVSDGGQDYQSALTTSLRLQLQNVAAPALLPNSSVIQKVKEHSEEAEQQPKSFDTEGSMESYDITWDIGNPDWDPVKKQQTQSSEYSFLNDESGLARQMSLRKNLDIKRWFCLSRPQYPSSAGISALVSCWNYLYSTLGHGNRDPVSQEVALTILGYQPPFSAIDSEAIMSNQGLIKSFEKLNEHYEVAGRGKILYKPQGQNQTKVAEDYTLSKIKKELKSEFFTFIYHCEKHFLCPMGYEDIPIRATDAYSGDICCADLETWIILGDTSSKYPGIQCKKWDHILMDLNCNCPDFLDIRRLDRGIRQRKNRQKLCDSNDHCILTFQKCQSDEKVEVDDEDESPLQDIVEMSDEEGLTNTRPPRELREVDRLDKDESDLLEDDMDEDDDCDNILEGKHQSVTESTLTDSDDLDDDEEEEEEESPSEEGWWGVSTLKNKNNKQSTKS